VPVLDGLKQVTTAPHGLIAIDPRDAPPRLVAFDDRGGERARLALPVAWTRERGPWLRCARARCIMYWQDARGGNVEVIEDDRDGRPTFGPRHAAALPSDQRAGWDLSPDGRWLASPAIGYANKTLLLHDVDRGTTARVACQRCTDAQAVMFSPDGGLLISDVVHGAAKGEPFSIVRRDADGRERVIWRGDAWVAAYLPIDDHQILINTIAYDLQLSLLER
jgi:hypothetical protein